MADFDYRPGGKSSKGVQGEGGVAGAIAVEQVRGDLHQHDKRLWATKETAKR